MTYKLPPYTERVEIRWVDDLLVRSAFNEYGNRQVDYHHSSIADLIAASGDIPTTILPAFDSDEARRFLSIADANSYYNQRGANRQDVAFMFSTGELKLYHNPTP